MILGFITPSILLFLPFDDPNTRQVVIALWQPAPVWISGLTTVFSVTAGIATRIIGCKKNSHEDTISDLPHLRALYQTTGVMAACVHLSLITASLFSAGLSLNRLFIPTDSFAPVATLAEGVLVFFQNDLLLVAASCFLWCLVSIWDLNRSGLSDVDLRVAFCGLLAGYVVIGPGATTAMVWFWREGVMSRTAMMSQ